MVCSRRWPRIAWRKRRMHPRTVLVPVLRKDRSEARTLTTALAELHVIGVSLDWESVFAGRGARQVELPTYAFQRERFWPEVSMALGSRDTEAADSVDARFWEAVEREDLQALAQALDIDGEAPLSHGAAGAVGVSPQQP
ncbi:hypothetical protein SANTM175S_07231 [Streptomyces antimycoticus]